MPKLEIFHTLQMTVWKKFGCIGLDFMKLEPLQKRIQKMLVQNISKKDSEVPINLMYQSAKFLICSVYNHEVLKKIDIAS